MERRQVSRDWDTMGHIFEVWNREETWEVLRKEKEKENERKKETEREIDRQIQREMKVLSPGVPCQDTLHSITTHT